MVPANRGRWRTMRLLRVVLACAMLWLSSGSAVATQVCTDAVVLVAAPSSLPPSKSAAARAPFPNRAKRIPFPRGVALLGALLATKPTKTIDTFVLVPDRYLENLALLC